jgi:hypothetical protein
MPRLMNSIWSEDANQNGYLERRYDFKWTCSNHQLYDPSTGLVRLHGALGSLSLLEEYLDRARGHDPLWALCNCWLMLKSYEDEGKRDVRTPSVRGRTGCRAAAW